MIPKIIHYCWFGSAPIPVGLAKYMESWKQYCPDYAVKLWNENNFPIDTFPFAKEALENKKYAFVADVCRIYALHKEGGIYLDTDMQLLRPLDSLLDHDVFFGYEDDGNIGVSIIGAERDSEFITDILNQYLNIEKNVFVNNKYLDYIMPKLITKVYKTKSLLVPDQVYTVPDYCTTYPSEYFYPKSYRTGILKITPDSFAIHHYDASWHDDKKQFLEDQRFFRLSERFDDIKADLKNEQELLYFLKEKFNIRKSSMVIFELKSFLKKILKKQ